MAALIVFLGLLALTRCALSENAESANVEVLNILHGREARLYVHVETSIENCVLRLNNGSTYSYTRNEEPIPEKVVNRFLYQGFDCGLKVRNVDENDAGYWTIEVYEPGAKEPQIFKFRLNVEQIIKERYVISVYEGHYAYMTADKVNTQSDQLLECQVTDPKGTSYSVKDLTSERFKQFGQCGVKMLATNSTPTGEWTIAVKSSEFYTYKSTYMIYVFTDEKYKEPVIHLERGRKGTISVGPTTTTYCEMKDPKGVAIYPNTKRCTYEIPTVTTHHDGVWTAVYGLAGKMNPVKITFNVTTYGVTGFSTTVETGENGEISFACHFSTDRFESCQFVRPDGAIVDYAPNVANGDYSSYGNASYSRSKEGPQFCGLKIWQPRARDYGAWKCYVREYETYRSTKLRGTILQIKRPTSDVSFHLIKTESKDIVVRRGDSFQISCSANEVLSYCWLRSPNGTDFSIARSKEVSPRTLQYEGSGLTLGDCRATLPAADNTHRGEWKCFMGVRNGTELEERFNVAVTDSYLIAEQEVIPVHNNIPHWIYMSCRVHPHVNDKTIDYCRWVRPDGYGINNIRNEQYLTKGNSTACSILVAHAESDVNIGEWNCVAGLAGSQEEEAWTAIQVQRVAERMSMTYIILICVSAVLVVFAATSLLTIQLRKRKRSLLNQQPQPCQQESSYLPPKYSSPTAEKQMYL